jgi:SpoVK/Ycf46/Vps4 family AAA+-type ATPase
MSTFADKARKLPGVAKVEGAVAGAVATEDDLPIQNYDKLEAAEIASKLKGFSQRDLRTIDAYERKRQNRATITDKIDSLSGDEPWSGYDESSVDGVTKALREADAETAREARTYERGHKGRSGVIEAADKRLEELGA